MIQINEILTSRYGGKPKPKPKLTENSLWQGWPLGIVGILWPQWIFRRMFWLNTLLNILHAKSVIAVMVVTWVQWRNYGVIKNLSWSSEMG